MAGHHDDFAVGERGSSRLQDMHAIDIVHDQIGNDDIKCVLFNSGSALGPAGGDRAAIADALEAFGHGARVGSIVVDNQDSEFARIEACLGFVGVIRLTQ